MRLLPLALTCTFLLGACGTDSEQAVLETYFTEADTVATDMVEIGTKFETLMNVQADFLAWTQAEKDELTSVLTAIDELTERSKAMVPPAELTSVHPLLIECLTEMQAAIHGVSEVALDPSILTEELAAEIEQHAMRGEELGNEYLEKLEAVITEEYPDLLEG